MPAPVSHKWVNQVLRQRGIPAPALAVIERSIAQSPPDQLDHLRTLALIVERGTDKPGDIELLIRLISFADDPGKVVSESPIQAQVSNAPSQPMQRQRQATDQTTRQLPKTKHTPQDRGVAPDTPNTDVDSSARPSYTQDKPKRAKHHIYASNAALTIEMDYLRGKPGAEPRQTVALEAAVKKEGEYDWEHKIIFQFMHRELPLLACMLLGWLNGKLRLGNHGDAGDKAVEIEDQAGSLFVRVREGPRMIPVPVVGPDAHAWFELVMRAMQANAPTVGDSLQMAMLKRVADMENSRKKNV